MSRFTRSAALCSAALLALTACGSDDKAADTSSAPASSTPATAAETAPSAPDTTAAVDTTSATDSTIAPDTTAAGGGVSVEAANGTVSLDAAATKIVSISPTHTEMLFAIAAGDQIIAVDDQSNFPAGAAAVASDLSGYTPNVEAIAAYEPDLVVMADDFNNLIPQLEDVGITVWSGPAATTLDDVYTQIEQLGVLTGHVGDAAELVGQMQTDLDAIIAEVPESDVPLTYYHELDNTLFSVTSDSFIGQLYSLAGLQNIADDADPGNAYPQLNGEYVVTADPQLIFLADVKCCGESVASVSARDGWAGISAVANNHVIELDDDVASRWGPRVVDYMRTIVDAVKAAAVPAG
jgi:iron complex transport system substrate-binding protein